MGGCFNPHPREAGDISALRSCASLYGFNPHPREAGDLQGHYQSPFISSFNPHPREAGDQPCIFVTVLAAVSIHTRVKRVTAGVEFEALAAHVSIHTRVKRVTTDDEYRLFLLRFQSTPA